MTTGLVLAGVGCEPLTPADSSELRRVAERLDPVVDDLVVVCWDEQRGPVADALDGIPHRTAVDPVADDGPVAAIRTGVRVTNDHRVAVVAGDVGVDADLFGRLLDACEDAAVPRAEGRLYPLHGVYDTDAVQVACERTLASGSGRLYDVLSRLDPAVVAADDPTRDSFTPETRARPDLTPATDQIGT